MAVTGEAVCIDAVLLALLLVLRWLVGRLEGSAPYLGWSKPCTAAKNA